MSNFVPHIQIGNGIKIELSDVCAVCKPLGIQGWSPEIPIGKAQNVAFIPRRFERKRNNGLLRNCTTSKDPSLKRQNVKVVALLS